jgi:tRNA(fMet)-specific endonuclease VapC
MLDSSVVIAAERRRLSVVELLDHLKADFGDMETSISVISAAELLHGCWRTDSAARRAAREQYIESVLAVMRVVPVTLETARVYGEISAMAAIAGTKLPVADLLIACTALVEGSDVVTGNVRHFQEVPGLVVHEWK